MNKFHLFYFDGSPPLYFWLKIVSPCLCGGVNRASISSRSFSITSRGLCSLRDCSNVSAFGNWKFINFPMLQWGQLSFFSTAPTVYVLWDIEIRKFPAIRRRSITIRVLISNFKKKRKKFIVFDFKFEFGIFYFMWKILSFKMMWIKFKIQTYWWWQWNYNDFSLDCMGLVSSALGATDSLGRLSTSLQQFKRLSPPTPYCRNYYLFFFLIWFPLPFANNNKFLYLEMISGYK